MNEVKKLTVFTPTYNRAHLLPRLYNSLCSQTQKNFEWLIVDDGSDDDTKQVVQSFVEEEKINIVYVHQVNSGKHIAINTGLDFAKGEWFFIVDSDDYLEKDALNIIFNYIITKSQDILSGFVFRKAYQNKNFVGSNFPHGKEEFIATIIERTTKYKVYGDMAEVFKTDLLRKCKFDDNINEKFCAEGLMWNRTARLNAKLLFVNRIVYICEYLDGGLTANSILNRRNSPIYASLVYKELTQNRRLPLKFKLKAYINYWRFALLVKKRFIEKIKDIDYNVIGLFLIPLGCFMKLRDDLKLKI